MKPTPEALRASPSRGRRWRTGEAGSAASPIERQPFHAARVARRAVELLSRGRCWRIGEAGSAAFPVGPRLFQASRKTPGVMEH